MTPPADLNQRFLIFYKLSQIRSPLVTAERTERAVITSFETYLRKQGLSAPAINVYCTSLENDFLAGRKKLVADTNSSAFPPWLRLLVNATLIISLLYLLVAAIFSWMPGTPIWSWTVYQYSLIGALALFLLWNFVLRKQRTLEIRVWDDRPIESSRS